MKTFTDNTGRAWNIRIDYNAVRALRAECNVDLLALPEKNFALIDRITGDICLAVDCLYCLCRDAKTTASRQIEKESFEQAMIGECIVTAIDAMIQEAIDFFPDPRKRELMKAILDKSRKVYDLTLDRTLGKTMETLAKIDPQAVAMQITESALPVSTSNPSGDTPESSG